eukprot:TRINITY_DN75259_c0_g1_i1.p1 TRINITY_DN75259_c0_g1~~TRINITY_DN75259_c0_g1_i1.p1  ORF type:complete len:326 (-),score=79.80 TRINITY_DN75259_c0_g1_i1:202-1179(-)
MKDDSEDSGDDRWYGKGKGKGKKRKGDYVQEEEDSDDSDDDLPYARKAAAYRKAKGKGKGKKGKGKGPGEGSSSDVESATEKPKAGEAGAVSAAGEGPDLGGSDSDEGSSEDRKKRMMLARKAGFDWNREARDAELDKLDDKQARYELKRKNREERKAKKYELRAFIAEEDKRRRKAGLEPMTPQEIEDLEPKKKEKRLAREAKAKEKEDRLAARAAKAKGKGWYGGWDSWSGSAWSGGWESSSWAAASSSVDWEEEVEPPPKRPRVEETVADPTSVPEWAKAQTRLFGHLPPLPEKWIRIRSKSTKMVYFYNLDSGESSFEMPS